MQENIKRIMENSSKYCYDLSKIIMAIGVVEPLISNKIDFSALLAAFITGWTLWMAGVTIDYKVPQEGE